MTPPAVLPAQALNPAPLFWWPRIRALGEADRDALQQHFMSLNANDRLMRFGQVTPDANIARYAANLDFHRDEVFGIVDGASTLLAVCHIAMSTATVMPSTAELGLSVAQQARQQGMGSALFAQAVTRCRRRGIRTVYMHCLARNATMMHIARRAGMTIEREGSEADACLKLAPPDGKRLWDVWQAPAGSIALA